MDISQSGVFITNNTVVSGKPIEVHNAAAINALLLPCNVGKVIMYNGQTDNDYTNGSLYVIAETE